MKILKWILIILIALIALYLVASATQPNKIEIEERIVIDAPPKMIYNEILAFKNWDQWSVWDQMDPNMKSEYSEEMGKIGSYTKWWSDNPELGNGSQEIVELKKNEYIKTLMQFEGWDAKNYAAFILEEKNGGTELKWTYDGAKTPFYMNLMNSFMKPMIVEKYKQSLSNLKSYIESMPEEESISNAYHLEIIEVDAIPIASILDSTNVDGISDKLAELYTEIAIFLETNQEATADEMTLAIYHHFSNDKVILEAAMRYTGKAKADGRLQLKEIPSGKAVKGIYLGDYNASGDMHDAIAEFIDKSGLTMAGPPWEVYANDPAEVDVEALETHIFYPVN